MIIYVYSKCSTCQKAIQFLTQHNIPYTRKEITETPPTVSELKKMLKFQGENLRKLFNTSGLLYRELQLSDKLDSMSQEEAFKLLSTNGMLVKRPFILGENVGLVGFNEKDWKAKL